MLMGTYENLIDAKNRYAVPAKFRDELGSKCVLTRGLDNCLVLYPLKTWEAETARIMSLPRTDAEARAFIRYTYGSAVECEIDKQGRTVLPAELRQFAGIDKELVTIGLMDRVEIWAKEIYDNDANGGLLSQDDFTRFSEKYQV